MDRTRPWYAWAVGRYDAVYRGRHHLNTDTCAVGPALRVEFVRSRWRHRCADGTEIRRGDLIGICHLNNDAVVRLHGDGRSATAVGLMFRRDILRSLRALAQQVISDPDLAGLRAITATTTLHRRMQRLGFEIESGAVLSPRLVAFYQRALLAWLHPGARRRLRAGGARTAERVWMSRATLLLGLAAAGALGRSRAVWVRPKRPSRVQPVDDLGSRRVS